MANLVDYVKTVWENGKTALNAARMNNMEQGISNCATQINKLGDSVSPFTDGTIYKITSLVESGVMLQIRFNASDDKAYGFSILKDGIQLWSFTDNATIWKISK